MGLLLCTMACADEVAAPSGLMCELMARPALTAVSDPHPEFGWVVNADVQSAYQILVASHREVLAEDTGDL